MKRPQQLWTRRFFASRTFLLTAFLIAVFVAFGYARAYYQDYKIKQEIKALQEEVKSLENKKLESMKILQYVTSPSFVEDKARTELNMKKPGEKVVVIKKQEEEQGNDKKADVDEAVLNNPLKWWYYFIHKQLPESDKE